MDRFTTQSSILKSNSDHVPTWMEPVGNDSWHQATTATATATTATATVDNNPNKYSYKLNSNILMLYNKVSRPGKAVFIKRDTTTNLTMGMKYCFAVVGQRCWLLLKRFVFTKCTHVLNTC